MHLVETTRSLRGTILLIAVCALGGVSLGDGAARADVVPTITVNYATPTSIQVSLQDGTAVHNGTIIPAGSYAVDVKDDPTAGDQNPNFSISGPGVSVSNNLNSSGMGIDGLTVLGPYTFQTNSSYAIEDKNLGASTLVTFTTSMTAATSGGATTSSGTSSSSGSSMSGGTSSSGSSSSTGATSAKATKGTLAVVISATGKLKLRLRNGVVSKLPAGTYRVVVTDDSKRAALIVARGTKHLETLSSPTKTGTTTHTLVLTKGTWSFLSGMSSAVAGSKLTFTVS